MMSHHGDEQQELSELMKRFKEQKDRTAKREYPAGRVSADDDGAIAYMVSCDATKVIRIDFNKPVAWVGLGPKEAIQLAQSLIKFARDISTEPIKIDLH